MSKSELANRHTDESERIRLVFCWKYKNRIDSWVSMYKGSTNSSNVFFFKEKCKIYFLQAQIQWKSKMYRPINFIFSTWWVNVCRDFLKDMKYRIAHDFGFPACILWFLLKFVAKLQTPCGFMNFGRGVAWWQNANGTLLSYIMGLQLATSTTCQVL